MPRASLPDFLQGAKKTGVRRFTDGAPDGFFRKPAVLPAIRARQHSPIRGFVPQNRKTREEFCAIPDLRAEEPRATAIPDSLCGEQERCQGMRPLPAHRKECPGDPPRPAGSPGPLRRFRGDAERASPRGVPPPLSCGVASCATYHSRETAFCPSRRKDAG